MMDLEKLIEALKENGLKDEDVAKALAALEEDIEVFLDKNRHEAQEEPRTEPEEDGKCEDKKESEGEKRLRVFGI